jgi:hypothetical protein
LSTVLELARWSWPLGVQAQLLALPAGLDRAAAQAHWQQALGPCSPALQGGVRVGWRGAAGQDIRVAYGHTAQPAHAVVLLAWRQPVETDPPAPVWAVDCTADQSPPDGDGAALLTLFGGAGPHTDFPLAWARLEAAAKCVGGLREHTPPPLPQKQASRREAGWVLSFAWAA